MEPVSNAQDKRLGQTGVTPVGTLRRLDSLPPKMQHELERAIAELDFDDALKELAEYFERQKQIEEVPL